MQFLFILIGGINIDHAKKRDNFSDLNSLSENHNEMREKQYINSQIYFIKHFPSNKPFFIVNERGVITSMASFCNKITRGNSPYRRICYFYKVKAVSLPEENVFDQNKFDQNMDNVLDMKFMSFIRNNIIHEDSALITSIKDNYINIEQKN